MVQTFSSIQIGGARPRVQRELLGTPQRESDLRDDRPVVRQHPQHPVAVGLRARKARRECESTRTRSRRTRCPCFHMGAGAGGEPASKFPRTMFGSQFAGNTSAALRMIRGTNTRGRKRASARAYEARHLGTVWKRVQENVLGHIGTTCRPCTGGLATLAAGCRWGPEEW